MPEIKEETRTTKQLVMTLTQVDLLELMQKKLGFLPKPKRKPTVGYHRFMPGGPNTGDGKGRDHVSCAPHSEFQLDLKDELRVTVEIE